MRGLEFAAALKACRADFERLCPQVPTGLGRGLGCLVQNAPALSPACRNALAEREFLDEPGDQRKGF
jgi:hypothetical protein